MFIRIANHLTGEVVEWRSCPEFSNTRGLGAIRGYIRNWMKNDTHPMDLDVLVAMGHAWLDEYLFDYAVDQWLDDNGKLDLEDEEELEDICYPNALFDDDDDDLLFDDFEDLTDEEFNKMIKDEEEFDLKAFGK